MFKTGVKQIRKRKNSSQFTRRGSNGVKKEGNLNVTDKRLTIPPRLFCLGVTSGYIKRSTSRKDKKNDCTLQEDIQGLFSNNIKAEKPKPRRSSRLSKQLHTTQYVEEVTASDCQSDDIKNRNAVQTKGKSDNSSHSKRKLKRNNSKSLFKDINERYARIRPQNCLPVNSSKNSSTNKTEGFQGTSFCRNLYKESRLETKTDRPLLTIKLRIAEKIETLNRALSGEPAAIDRMTERKERKNSGMETEEELTNHFDYFRKCEWVYDTPPRQKIALPKIDECAIKPAIMCTNKKQSNIYELNPNIKIDVNKFNNKNIEIDGRYMWHVASFDNTTQMDIDVSRLDNQAVSYSETFDNNYQDQQEYANPQLRRVHPFMDLPQNYAMPVLSRPTKTARKIPRETRVFKRKLDESESTPVASNMYDFESDITVINDDGNFRIVSQQSLAHNNTFDFNFKRNLFEIQGEKNVFNFPKEEKVFDFSQMKKNTN